MQHHFSFQDSIIILCYKKKIHYKKLTKCEFLRDLNMFCEKYDRILCNIRLS